MKIPFTLGNEFVIRGPLVNGVPAWEERIFNSAAVAGLADCLGVLFNAQTQRTGWYFGLIDNSGFTAVAAADTPASHAGWAENTDYDSETRPAWNEGTATAGTASASITSSSVTTFTTSVGSTIAGIGLFSDSQKGGTGGVLFCTSLFTTPRSFGPGDSWEVTSYTVNARG